MTLGRGSGETRSDVERGKEEVPLGKVDLRRPFTQNPPTTLPYHRLRGSGLPTGSVLRKQPGDPSTVCSITNSDKTYPEGGDGGYLRGYTVHEICVCVCLEPP